MHDMIKKNSLGIVDFCFMNNGLAHNFGNEVIERLDLIIVLIPNYLKTLLNCFCFCFFISSQGIIFLIFCC